MLGEHQSAPVGVADAGTPRLTNGPANCLRVQRPGTTPTCGGCVVPGSSGPSGGASPTPPDAASPRSGRIDDSPSAVPRRRASRRSATGRLGSVWQSRRGEAPATGSVPRAPIGVRGCVLAVSFEIPVTDAMAEVVRPVAAARGRHTHIAGFEGQSGPLTPDDGLRGQLQGPAGIRWTVTSLVTPPVPLPARWRSSR